MAFFGASLRAATPEPVPLWQGDAPGALGKSSGDIPTITAYLPDQTNATGAALIVLPGGGYTHLAEHEGKDYALWLKAHGIAGFVVNYRLGPKYHHPCMLQDAARGLRTVRANAKAWKIDPDRIGVIGSSAGGHLASTLLTHFDGGNPNDADPVERVSSRPDLGVLCYPVITMGDDTHKGSFKNLLGTNATPELIEFLSNEKQVTSNTPPCFIFSTAEDKTVPVQNSLEFAAALQRAHVPFDLHIYEKGAHGMGLGPNARGSLDPAKMHPWTADCLFFLKQHGFIKK